VPTVKQRDWRYRHVSVLCPLCTDGTRITRDALAWQTHMEASHSAVAGTWADTGIRGDQEGPADNRYGIHRFANKCFGCSQTFATNALLVTHLDEVHSAT